MYVRMCVVDRARRQRTQRVAVASHYLPPGTRGMHPAIYAVQLGCLHRIEQHLPSYIQQGTEAHSWVTYRQTYNVLVPQQILHRYVYAHRWLDESIVFYRWSVQFKTDFGGPTLPIRLCWPSIVLLFSGLTHMRRRFSVEQSSMYVLHYSNSPPRICARIV
jgi:hypothetical protein